MTTTPAANREWAQAATVEDVDVFWRPWKIFLARPFARCEQSDHRGKQMVVDTAMRTSSSRLRWKHAG